MQTPNNILKFSSKIAIALSLFILSITACKKSDAEMSGAYRTIAWNYLNTSQQATVTVDWKTAPVEKYNYKDEKGVATDAIMVMFHTKDDALLGPIQVFIAIKTKTVIGIGGRF